MAKSKFYVIVLVQNIGFVVINVMLCEMNRGNRIGF